MKLYIIAPKPQYNCEDMPVFVIIASNEDECWKLVYYDYTESKPISKSSKEYLDENFIIREIIPVAEETSRIVWGNTLIGYGK